MTETENINAEKPSPEDALSSVEAAPASEKAGSSVAPKSEDSKPAPPLEAPVPASTSATATASATTTSSSVTTCSFGNFDVLLTPDPQTGKLHLATSIANKEGPSSSSSSNNNSHVHIGNTRFQVTLDMHRHDFVTRHERLQDTSPTVQKLIAIVTEQCVPPGRFLCRSSSPDDSAWTNASLELVEEFIERSLLPVNNNKEETKKEEKEKTPGSPAGNRRVSFLDNMEPPMPLIEDSSENSLSNGSSLDEADQIRLLAFAKARRALSSQQAPPGPPPPQQREQQQKQKMDEEKKRRRRSSLLRRSLSDHLLPIAREVDEKKKMNRTTEERRPSLWRALFKHKIVKNLDMLDIVLVFLSDSGDKEAADLMPNHTGNNRLRVLMQMSKDKYSAASIDEQAQMCKDWIQTVTTYWKGRFLKYDAILEQYEVLETGQVEMALDGVMIRMIGGEHDLHWNQGGRGLTALTEGSKEFDQNSSHLGPEPSSELSSNEFQMGSGGNIATNFARGSRSAEFSKRNKFGRSKGRQSSQSSVATAPVQSSSASSSDSSLRRSMRSLLPKIGRGSSEPTLGTRRLSTTLPEPPAGLLSEEAAQAQRNAAVESLQRRKKRQGLASRIQKMAQNSFLRASFSSKQSSSSEMDRRASVMSVNSVMSTGNASNAMSVASTSSTTTPSMFPPPPTTIYSSRNNRGGGNLQNRNTSDMSTSSISTMGMDGSGNVARGIYSGYDPSSSFRRTSNSSMSTSGSSLMPTGNNRMQDSADSKLPADVYTQNLKDAPSPIPSSNVNTGDANEALDLAALDEGSFSIPAEAESFSIPAEAEPTPFMPQEDFGNGLDPLLNDQLASLPHGYFNQNLDEEQP